jgi:hypothetical protein
MYRDVAHIPGDSWDFHDGQRDPSPIRTLPHHIPLAFLLPLVTNAKSGLAGSRVFAFALSTLPFDLVFQFLRSRKP